MMYYAQVVFQAEKLGCDPDTARTIARKIVTTAALLAVMPEDVFKIWSESRSDLLSAPSSDPGACPGSASRIDISERVVPLADMAHSKTLQIMQSLEL